MADKPKLTRAERKQIEAVIRKYRGDGKPHTAQDTIPYQIMYPDGICYLGNRRYSQSIEFFDINYLLAQPDDQTAIFEYLCDLYNYLDSSIHVQFTYPNRKSDREQLARSFEMPPCNDGLDPIRQEQTDILKRQLARGNNGSVKTKYITYTIEADNLKAARARLSRISLDMACRWRAFHQGLYRAILLCVQEQPYVPDGRQALRCKFFADHYAGADRPHTDRFP